MHGLVAKKDLEFQGSLYESYIDTFNFDFKTDFFPDSGKSNTGHQNGYDSSLVWWWGLPHNSTPGFFFPQKNLQDFPMVFRMLVTGGSLLYGPPVLRCPHCRRADLAPIHCVYALPLEAALQN